MADNPKVQKERAGLMYSTQSILYFLCDIPNIQAME